MQLAKLVCLVALLAIIIITYCFNSAQASSFRLRAGCEGRAVKLSCRKGYSVHAVSAFYGRASSRYCIRSRVDLKRWLYLRRKQPICTSHIALKRVRQICDGKRSCRVPIKNKIFGNPCRGVSKYLRIKFVCKFSKCKKVRYYHEKILKKYKKYRNRIYSSSSKKRGRKFKKKLVRLMKKVNKIRQRYRSCFDCARGCRYLHYVERRFAKRERKVHQLMKNSYKNKQRSSWTARTKRGWGRSRRHGRRVGPSRMYLRRKLWYYRRHRRLIARHLKRCLKACFY